jgi:hypothetical protein
MIETQFFILDAAQFQEYSQLADEAGVSIDYYLAEFCDVEGPDVYVD